MSERGRAIYFLGLVEHEALARRQADELARMYARPDAPPLPEDLEPVRGPSRRAGLRRLLERARPRREPGAADA